MDKATGKFTPRFWAMIVAIGFVLACVISGITFANLYQQSSERASNTVEYVKKQSLECELVNNVNVMKSQIRVMQNASQAARDVAEGEGDVNDETLARYVKDLNLTSMFVLGPDGTLVGEYRGDEDTYDELESYLAEEEVLDVASHPKKVYSTRLSFADGSYADLSCASRIDAPGIVVVAYHTKAAYANRFLLTVQSLLDGYRITNDTSVVVEKDGEIIASNTDADDVEGSSDEQIVTQIRESCKAGQMHMVRGGDTYYYGTFGKTRDYTVYTFTKASEIMHEVASNAFVGVMIYVLLVAIFTTNRRRSEQEHLETMLDQRQQYTSQLEQAVKIAEAANAAKTDFLQRMSHDLRTPLNGIRGMVEVGNAYADDALKQAECRDKIWNASGILLDLVNEALDISKLEGGKIVLETETVDLDPIIDDVCAMVERQALERNISISRERSDVAHPRVKSSALYLRRLLMNVATNAVKYNKFGGEVSISHRELSFEDGVAVHQVVVADTGIGMSAEYMEHLFEPFTREEQELDYKPSGTGLGMPITKQLVELMGGEIECESELGRGTVCTITIPFDVAEEDETPVNGVAGDEEATLAGMKLLLVEDNELNREIAEFVVESADGEVVSAGNGKEALDAFEASAPG